MAKPLTDKTLISKFLSRGVEAVYPTKDALEKRLYSGERIRAYQGFDPSGPFLHVGHAMGIRSLRILQQLGHEVIFLVGDYTAKVGDPDKDTGRGLLSDKQIEENMSGWKEQATQLIDFEGENPVLFKRNYEWLSKLTLADLIDLMSKATVQQMLERDLFQRRIAKKDPIGLQEFIYPLMQGYDAVKMEVDLEIGGTDQTFNMLVGRSLVKSYLNKEKFVRTHELMEAPDTLTMSKTKGNGINLSDSPENMYGKAMSYPDALITKALRLLTDVEMEDIWQIEKEIEKGENPMKFKKMMAFEVVKIVKGKKAAAKAQNHFEKTVQQKQVLDEQFESVNTSGTMSITDFLKNAAKDSVSTNEIKRLIEQGGVEVNGEKTTDPSHSCYFAKGTVVKMGKRRYFKVS